MALDDCTQGDIVEEVGEQFPDSVGAVLPEAFVVEAVDLGDSSGFVVSPQFKTKSTWSW